MEGLTKTEAQNISGMELATWIARQIDRKGGIRVQVLDLQGVSDVTDFIVLATGTSKRHMQTLIDASVKELRKSGHFVRVDGDESDWIVADLGDVIVHVFDDPTRSHYNLEGLYSRAPDVDWQADLAQAEA